MAVIAILAALLSPALRTARESAKKVQCASNLRQIGVAWLAYATEHDGAASPGYDNGNYFRCIDDILMGKVGPAGYGYKSPVWICPKHPEDGKKCYGLNRSLYQASGNQTPTLGRIRRASQKVCFAETVGAGGGLTVAYSSIDAPPGGIGYYGHGSGMNVLFCDVHVEWLPSSHPVLNAYSNTTFDATYWNVLSD